MNFAKGHVGWGSSSSAALQSCNSGSLALGLTQAGKRRSCIAGEQWVRGSGARPVPASPLQTCMPVPMAVMAMHPSEPQIKVAKTQIRVVILLPAHMHSSLTACLWEWQEKKSEWGCMLPPARGGEVWVPSMPPAPACEHLPRAILLLQPAGRMAALGRDMAEIANELLVR